MARPKIEFREKLYCPKCKKSIEVFVRNAYIFDRKCGVEFLREAEYKEFLKTGVNPKRKRGRKKAS